nr:DNA-directed RNA polymerase III subunit rpc6-like [Quercus suber]
MNRSQGLSSLKRKQPDSKSPIESLTEHKRILYNLIRRKQDMAIWTRDMKNIPDNVLHKSPKSLQARKLIKEVVTIQNKGRKHYIATEFEPSKEITGGAWYVEGSLDTEFINFLKKHCVKIIYEQKIVTLEEILDTIRRSRAFNVEFTTQQIEEIANYIATDSQLSKLKRLRMLWFWTRDIGGEEYWNGAVCYRCASKAGLKAEPKTGAMASIPCGVCPQISLCTPDGIISPTTCVYYTKWLDF